MKKIIYTVVLAVTALALTACAGKKNEEPSQEESTTQAVAVSLEEIHKAVKDAYGDQYIPSYEYDEQLMEDLFGISGDLYEEYIGEGPMISAHIDNFIALKAKEGKGEDVEALLNKYRDSMLTDSMQYPSNQYKIQASQVVRHGDCVFFVMLGTPDQDAEEQGEEEALKSAQENNQIAVDVIDGFFR